ncbi:MAG: class I SAM-dependent methyltransferase [Eubacteriales bacterium]|nr:class I SAM-dependent methyltransferase [Eubacteriales bacterium]
MYGDFAEVYDSFQEDIPYAEWLEHVTELLSKYEIKDGLVLELGCGTGTFTEMLSEAGYDMIGVDNSEEMLQRAMEKRTQTGSDILYLLQDMREFELYGTVRAVVSVCDSMNYITEEEDLEEVFALVNNYLDPGGIFLFDLKTACYYREVMGNGTFAENRETGSYIWENAWYEDEQINEYDLTLFLRQEDGSYRKSEETHLQRAYDTARIAELIRSSGMEYLGCLDAESLEEADETSERVYILARECTK